MNRIDILYQNSVLWYSNLSLFIVSQLSYYFDFNPVWYFEYDFAMELDLDSETFFKCSVFFYWRFAGQELLPFGQIETIHILLTLWYNLNLYFQFFFLDLFTLFKNLCSWIKNNIDFLVNRRSTLYYTQMLKGKKHFYR